MVIDSSALIAVLLQQPEAAEIAQLMEADPTRLVSAGNYLEAAIVIEARRGAAGGRDLDLLLHAIRAETVGFSAEQAEVARTAWRRYGKGRHPAGLNFGDCMAYALSKTSGEPLLFVGADFTQTDVASLR
ncbi:MAG: type II toxin-antitoxin system VapC family toxin [Terriglobales bacterium]